MPTSRSVRPRRLKGVVLVAACLSLIGSAAVAEDFVFTPIDEIPEGPGLVTDESGEFTIFKWSRDKNRTSENAEAAPAPPAPGTVTTSGGITEGPTPE